MRDNDASYRKAFTRIVEKKICMEKGMIENRTILAKSVDSKTELMFKQRRG